MSTLRSRSVFLDVASAAVLALGSFDVSLLPAAARVTLAIVLFLGIGRLSLRLARFLLPGEDRATTITAALILLAACETVTETALGHFGVLTPRAILLAAAFALLAAAALARPASAPAPTVRAPQPDDAPERAAILAAVAFFSVSTVAAIFLQRNAPPGAHGFDDTSYHLPAVATWYQWHDLRSLKFPIGDGSTAFYPIAGELFSFFLLVPLGDIDFLARWSEVPFALASLVALASLARLLSLRAGAAWVAVLLYAASPRVFPSGMLTAGNDHATGFFILASACGALLLRRGVDPRRATFLGASLGLLIGTKYTGLMFLPPLLLMAGACAASGLLRTAACDRRSALRANGLGCVAGALTMLGVGGYTYLRNAVASGNPLFPATISVAGHRLFQGLSGDTLAGFAVRGRSEIEAIRFLWDRVDLLGPLFRWIVLPSAVLAPLLAFVIWLGSRIRRSRRVDAPRVEAGEVILLTLPAVLYLTFVRLMVDHRDIRYVYGGLALAGIAVAWLLERLPSRASRLGRRAVLLAVLGGLALAASQRKEGGEGVVFACGAVSAAIVLAYILWRRPTLRWPKIGLTAGTVAVAGAIVALASAGGGRILETYQARKLDTVPAAVLLDRAAPSGSMIAICGGNQPYLFFGRRLQNRVLYVPTYAGPPAEGRLTPPLGASFFSWRGPLAFPRDRAVHEEWRENLRRLQVGFVVVVRTGDEQPERDWIAIEPAGFSRIYGDVRTEVFSVRETPSRADRLRVDFDRPESDYFLLPGAWRREKRAGSDRAMVVVPQDGMDAMIPPLDEPATAVRLEADNLGGSVPSLRLSLNGRIAEGVALHAHELSFRVEASDWRAGRNRISITPTSQEGIPNIRVAALDFTLDATRRIAHTGSGELPGNLDTPAEGSLIRGDVLAVAGWCRERGGGRIDPVRFTIDGRDATALRSARTDRPDVVKVLPYIVEPKETGFTVDLDVSRVPAGNHSLVVEFETPDGRHRLFPPRRFRLVR